MRPTRPQSMPVRRARVLDRIVGGSRTLPPAVEDAQDERTGRGERIHLGAASTSLSAYRYTRNSPGKGSVSISLALPAVIRMASQYLLGAIELFEQHPSDQQMRPGHRAKRQDYVGAVEHPRVETLGATDREGKLG